METDAREEEVEVVVVEGQQESQPGLWSQLRRAAGVDEVCSADSLVFGVFLLLLTIVGTTRVGADHYRLASHLGHELVDRPGFRRVASVEDLWTYVEGPFIEAALGDAGLAFQNLLLAPPRLRLLKVRNDSCVTWYEEKARPGRVCYDFFSNYAEDRSPYGPGSPTAWVHSALEGPSYLGLYATYPAGGFHEDLPLEQTEAAEVVRNLREGGWIAAATRAVFAELAVYNVHVNLLCVARLLVEFPPQGGAFPSWRFSTAWLPRHRSALEVFLLMCEVAVLVLALLLLLLWARRVIQLGRQYTWCSWNTARATIFLLTFVWAGLNFHAHVETLAVLASPVAGFPDYARLEVTHRLFVDVEGLLLAAAWTGALSYLRVSKSARRVGRALLHCWPDVLVSVAMLVVIFLAYLFLAVHVLGPDVPSFSTILAAAFSLLQAPSVDFDSVQATHWFLGPAFYLSYVFVVFFVLSGVTAAFVLRAYSETAEEDVPSVFGVLKEAVRPVEEEPTMEKRLLERGLSQRDVQMVWAELGLEPGEDDGLEEALSRVKARRDDGSGSRVVSRRDVTSLEDRVAVVTFSLEAAREKLVAALDTMRTAAV